MIKLEEFFSNKENLNSFVNAKSEEEAKGVLELAGVSLTDEEFDQVVGGLKAAVADASALSDTELEEISGGSFKGAMGKVGSALTSSTAKKVYKGALIGDAALAGAGAAFGAGFGTGWFMTDRFKKGKTSAPSPRQEQSALTGTGRSALPDAPQKPEQWIGPAKPVVDLHDPNVNEINIRDFD